MFLKTLRSEDVERGGNEFDLDGGIWGLGVEGFGGAQGMLDRINSLVSLQC